MAESEKDFPDNAEGTHQKWVMEFAAAKKFCEEFWKQGDKVVKVFLDERMDQGNIWGNSGTRLNIFNANITTLQSMLYGRIPKVEVDRRFADQDDDVARVASVILQRILNTDIEDAGEDYSTVLRFALQDKLLPGMGTARLRYDCEITKEEVPAVTDPMTGAQLAPAFEKETVADCWTDTMYVHWRDILWSPCRTYSEMRWRAYAAYLTRDELVARFGEKVGKMIPLNSKGPLNPEKQDDQKPVEEPWSQAKIWEVWDKQKRKIYWFCEGYDKILDEKDDFLQLEGFFPEPPPMMSNVTTAKYVAKSDYMMAADLYNEINIMQNRIQMLTEACKCVGVYDKANDGIQRLMNEGVENQLIPVDNWAAFAEKGGLKGVVDWMPIEAVANVIAILRQQLEMNINQLYQVTGLSDILRGAAQQANVSATEQSIKAKFASIRVQALQDEFARFASDMQRIKAEIIAKHYPPEIIMKASNIETSPDAQLAMQAIELIKDPDASRWKITIKPETLAMVDYAQLKMDRTEYINALAVFLQSAAPLVEMDSGAISPLLELLKWGLAGFKGSNEIEGVMDQAIKMFKDKAAKEAEGGGKQSPEQIKAQAEMQKAQMEMQKMQMEMQGKQAEHQGKMEQMQMQFQMKMEEMKMKHDLELAKIRMEMMQTFQEQKLQAEGAVVEGAINERTAKVQMESKDKSAGRGKSK
jgi:hypothetical protein